ncbi:MAG: D-alanine--D-alanine ligase [Holosporaceae bacterium]|jgi:D-alanine-D-alanine ligase|nr:D-alanine--D-alanine ligase [Holosporaceae bacterium]
MNRTIKKICLLKGGNSFERDISLVSAKECSSAIRQLGYEMCEFDFTGDAMALILHIQKEKPDCVFNSLHGGSGENGNVQSILNFLRIPYTHSGVVASSIAMHKYISGKLFESNGIRIPKNNFEKWSDFVKKIDFPCPFVIKPVDSGSSDGVYILNNPAELNDVAWEYGDMVLVSEYIPGLELTVGVLNDQPLAVTNIIASVGFYDYKNKYTPGQTFHEIPARIPDAIREEALEVAAKAHKLIGCRCVSRSDFRYNDVTRELFLLEVNTQPGMTPLSLLPEQAKFVGIPFEKLIQYMIEQSCYDK